MVMLTHMFYRTAAHHTSMIPPATLQACAEADGDRTGAKDSSSAVWCPIPFVSAMLSNPGKVMDLPEGTSKVAAAARLCQALRKADWSVKRFILLVPMYAFLQTNVVEPAFKFINTGDIKAAIRSTYSSLTAIVGVPELIDTTTLITLYHAFLCNPRGSGTYAPLMRALAGAIDRFAGHQTHTWGEDNRPRFQEVIASTTTPLPTGSGPKPSASARSSPPPRGPPTSAGSSARTVVSPGNPGPPKARYVDALRSRVVPSALFGNPGPAAGAPAAPLPPAAAPPATPAGQPPAAPALAPMGLPSAAAGFQSPAPGFPPMAPGGYPMPYGYPGFPFPGFPWAAPGPQAHPPPQ